MARQRRPKPGEVPVFPEPDVAHQTSEGLTRMFAIAFGDRYEAYDARYVESEGIRPVMRVLDGNILDVEVPWVWRMVHKEQVWELVELCLNTPIKGGEAEVRITSNSLQFMLNFYTYRRVIIESAPKKRQDAWFNPRFTGRTKSRYLMTKAGLPKDAWMIKFTDINFRVIPADLHVCDVISVNTSSRTIWLDPALMDAETKVRTKLTYFAVIWGTAMIVSFREELDDYDLNKMAHIIGQYRMLKVSSRMYERRGWHLPFMEEVYERMEGKAERAILDRESARVQDVHKAEGTEAHIHAP